MAFYNDLNEKSTIENDDIRKLIIKHLEKFPAVVQKDFNIENELFLIAQLVLLFKEWILQENDILPFVMPILSPLTIWLWIESRQEKKKLMYLLVKYYIERVCEIL